MNNSLIEKIIYFFCMIFLFISHIEAEYYKLCDGFEYCDIGEKDFVQVINGYTDNEYLRKEDIRFLRFKCYDYDGKIKTKSAYSVCSVNDPVSGKEVNVAKELLNIFKELFDKKFKINNVGCLNYRYIADLNMLSNHSFGTAVDINYERNPCVVYDKNHKIVSRTGEKKYLDRSLNEPGMIKSNDIVVKTFNKYGWWWAGNGWRLSGNKTKLDYMHFDRFSKQVNKKYPKKVNTSITKKTKNIISNIVLKFKKILKYLKNKFKKLLFSRH